MIQRSRTWRQASPALVTREPGYCTKRWISTPFSAPGSVLKPSFSPELRTPRQNGALLPGCVFARCALVSFGCGSGGATKPAGGPFIAADAGAEAACCAEAAQHSAASVMASMQRRRIAELCPMACTSCLGHCVTGVRAYSF